MDPEVMLALAAANHAAQMIEDYEILLGTRQVALLHRPSQDFVAVFRLAENETTVSVSVLFLALAQDSLNRKAGR